MPNVYAQIDENGVCFSVAQLAGPVDDPFMIEVDAFDSGYIGMTFPGAVLPSKAEIDAGKGAVTAARAAARASRGWV